MAAEQDDILHPLSTLDWEQCCSLPEAMGWCQCVLLGDEIYMTGYTSSSPDDGEMILVSSSSLNSWSEVTAPSHWYSSESDWLPVLTPTESFALTTYHSDVVLVGGREISVQETTNKLWVLEDGNKWKDSLPPMPTARSSLSAVNPGCPECIIAVGGRRGQSHLDTVEVLLDGCWSTVRPLPQKDWGMKPTLHNGSLYMVDDDSVCKCDVKALIESNTSSVWSQFEASVPLPNCSVVSCRQRLVAIGGEGDSPSSKIHVYSPNSHSWVYAENMPVGMHHCTAIALPYDDVVLMGGQSDNEYESDKVYRMSFSVSPYDPGDKFGMSSLSRLEEANIPIITALTPKETLSQLVSAAGITLDEEDQTKLADELCKNEWVEVVIDRWHSGASKLPPTWKSLHDTLRAINLADLSQEIVDFLSGLRSLKDICSAVIVSALMQQKKSLEPDQLQTRLPQYVSPSIKNLIIRRYMNSMAMANL